MKTAAACCHIKDDAGMSGSAEDYQRNEVHGAMLRYAGRKVQRGGFTAKSRGKYRQ
jgi:hypothetical protein